MWCLHFLRGCLIALHVCVCIGYESLGLLAAAVLFLEWIKCRSPCFIQSEVSESPIYVYYIASSIHTQVFLELQNTLLSHYTWFMTCCQDNQPAKENCVLKYLQISQDSDPQMLCIIVTMWTDSDFLELIRFEGIMWVMAFPSRPSRSVGMLCLYTVLTAVFMYVISHHVTCPIECITAALFFWAVSV